MFNEIDFSKIDTSITPPQDDTERQYYYMAKLAEMVALRERELGRRITYCLQTFGCQMNEKQSEVVAGIMDEIGFKRQETEDADVVIIIPVRFVRMPILRCMVALVSCIV